MSDDDLRRRRRLTPSGPRRSSGGGNSFTPWLITIVAAIAVIAGGWFLGQSLARVFNGQQDSNQVAQQPTPLSVTPLPSASPAEAAATAAPSPTASPSATPARQTPSPKPTKAPAAVAVNSPTVAPTAEPTVAATPAPTSTPTPVAETRKTQPIARRSEPTSAPVTAAPAAQEDAASRTVRAYIEALRRGDPSSAATYLGNGVPDESFIDGSTRIASITSTRNTDGSYKVEVDMKTSQGEYYETFIVASTGTANRILDKTAIKP